MGINDDLSNVTLTAALSFAFSCFFCLEMKLLISFLFFVQLVCIINADSVTISFYGDHTCSDSVLVYERTGLYQSCQNLFLDSRLPSDTECVRSTQCITATDFSEYCDSVVSLVPTNIFAGDEYDIRVSVLESRQACEDPEREEYEFDIPIDTCLKSRYQGCYYMVRHIPNVETENSSSLLSIPIVLFTLLVGFLF